MDPKVQRIALQVELRSILPLALPWLVFAT